MIPVFLRPFFRGKPRATHATLDAERSYLKGDLRFIATKSWHGYLPGVTEDALVVSVMKRYDLKVVVMDESLAKNEEFLRLKEKYETLFNRTLYGLIAKAERLRHGSQ